MGAVALIYGMSQLTEYDRKRIEESQNNFANEQLLYFENLKKQFVDGESNSYTITNKSMNLEKTIKGVVLDKEVKLYKPTFVIKNNKNNKVYEIKTTESFYLSIPSQEPLIVTESKDGKTIKIDATGDVFELGKLFEDSK